MTAVIIIGAVSVVIGVPLGIWLRPSKARPPARSRSHAGAAAAGVGFTCAACGHGHSLEEVRRSLYLGQRTIGDYQAARKGRLGRRLARRAVTRTLMRHLWGN